MIRVLKNWNEIGEASKSLARHKLPAHSMCEKNWDLFQFYELTKDLSRDSAIADLGCGSLELLKMLHTAGFKELYGIDLSIKIKYRLSQLARMAGSRTFSLPFHLAKGDLTKTPFKSGFFGAAASVSVIEHGVDSGLF